MVADFASANYGFLRFKNERGTWDSARKVFKAGDGREGYMTNEDVLAQATEARKILQKHCPDELHFFVFDNATTHTKRRDDALSARHMPKYSKPWGPPEVVLNADGKPVKRTTKGQKGKKGRSVNATQPIHICDVSFADGSPQPLYLPDGHPNAGEFKGMRVILDERGIDLTDGHGNELNAECKGFRCPDKRNMNARCCLRRILFNQKDFVEVKSRIQEECEADGFGFLFLLKFHCELNFIEHCWCHAKRTYRVNPKLTLTEIEMEAEVLRALDDIPLEQHRKYARRCVRFMDAYQKGLTAKQAAWADKKYHGHRMLPDALFRDIE